MMERGGTWRTRSEVRVAQQAVIEDSVLKGELQELHVKLGFERLVAETLRIAALAS